MQSSLANTDCTAAMLCTAFLHQNHSNHLQLLPCMPTRCEHPHEVDVVSVDPANRYSLAAAYTVSRAVHFSTSAQHCTALRPTKPVQ